MVKTPARRNAPVITVIDGQPTTTSRDIAETFGKRHDDVLKRIRSLDCSPEFIARNFAANEFTDAIGRTLTEYRITRDGFAFLCMGFTGAKAAQWKERYINTFNRMAEKLDTTGGIKPRQALPKAATAPLRIGISPARITPEMEAAVNARAFEIVTNALPAVRQWLTNQVQSHCISPSGGPMPHFASTLASADFAAYTTQHASRSLTHALAVLNVLSQQTAESISRVNAARAGLMNSAS